MSSSRPSGHPLRTRRVRFGLLIAVAALSLSGLAIVPAAAQDPGDPAALGAGWLAGQMVDGERFETTFDGVVYPDHGLTIDAALGFAAAGAADTAGSAAADWLGRDGNTSAYTGDEAAGEAYAGPIAKLALLAQVRGLDPTSFGNENSDLIARLESLEAGDGWFEDRASWPGFEPRGFTNSIGQSLAIIVLHRQPGTDPSVASVDLLVESQCADGGFSLDLQPDPADCVSGPDTTAFAVQALLAVGRTVEAEAGLDHLVSSQHAGGGFSAPDSGTPNANSTGTAGQALRAGGRLDAAVAAEEFVIALQQGCEADPAAHGAIAFDAGGFDESTAPRATAQALLAFAPAGLAELTSDGAAAGAPTLDCPAGGPGPAPSDPGDPEATRAAAPSGPGPDTVGVPAVAVVAQPTYTG
jgi:hypothetical protein